VGGHGVAAVGCWISKHILVSSILEIVRSTTVEWTSRAVVRPPLVVPAHVRSIGEPDSDYGGLVAVFFL